MKINTASYLVLGTFVLAILLVVGILRIQQAHAQVDATSSDTAATTSESVVPVDTATSTPENPTLDTTAAPTQAAAETSGLVEVQLQCSQSYTTDVYDTPSGRPDPYVKPDTATTTDTSAHVIGQQSYTICHDARGNVHEFKITAAEYAVLQVRGTPQKSVMETPDEAALDAFPVEAPAAPASDTPPVTTEPSGTVLGASTTSQPAPSDTSTPPADTTPNPAPDSTSTTSTPADTASTSTTTPTPTDTTAPAATSEDSATPPVTNDSAADASQAPPTGTTTDTPSI
jgi:hypothetical protein